MAAQLSMPLDLRTPAAAAHQTAHQTAAAHQRLPLLMLHPLPAAAASAAADTDCNQAAHQTKLPPAMLPLPEGPALAKIELPPAMLPLPEGPALAKAELFDVPLDVGSEPVGKRSRRLVNVPGQPFLADSQFPQQPHPCQASTSPR